jgi:hypothetical protein
MTRVRAGSVTGPVSRPCSPGHPRAARGRVPRLRLPAPHCLSRRKRRVAVDRSQSWSCSDRIREAEARTDLPEPVEGARGSTGAYSPDLSAPSARSSGRSAGSSATRGPSSARIWRLSRPKSRLSGCSASLSATKGLLSATTALGVAQREPLSATTWLGVTQRAALSPTT